MGRRLVQVAVDAAGVPGGRTFTYHVPLSLEPLSVGEAVLVGYGNRQAIGLVLGEGEPTEERETKPVLARVRSDGPLLPALSAALARHVSEHYLSPPGITVRQMLPPGLLERAELVARVAGTEAVTPSRAPTTFGDAWTDPATAALLQVVSAAGEDGIAVEDLPLEGSRATRSRRLRQLESDGAVTLEWRILPADARLRMERTATLTDAGRTAAAALEGGGTIDGRPLGPRQRELLLEMAGLDEPVVRAADMAGRHGPGALTSLARRGYLALDSRAVPRRPLADRSIGPRGSLPTGAGLTPAQAEVVSRLEPLIVERRHVGLLLEGVAASGKTAVYAALVAAAIRADRPALVLVPEIALAVPLIDRLRHDLGTDVALLHSALGEGERADEWRRIRSGEARVVVGTRMAALAPLDDVGIVVVDEEHDPAYKSDRTPRYQARDVALELGRLAGAPVVLGSATPDVVSVGRARLGTLEHVHLADRASGQRARVEVVDLRSELAEGNRGLLSASLVSALRELDVAAGDRAILVINRRGSASVVLCRDCGYVQICPECQRPLVFHAAAMALRCHHCGATAPVARRCPACGSARIRYLGGGTERVEREVGVRFPELRVGRLDRDVVERRGEAARVMDAFADGSLDVLVGTSLVTKGIDVPEVTLVGVVSADIALNLPDERAAERTWQLLEQAVGRAGRGGRPGKAIIQTYLPDHPAVLAVASGDATAFLEEELEGRRRFGSPPFGRVIKLTVANEDRDRAEDAAREMAAVLRSRVAATTAAVTVLGPMPAYVARRAGRWRFHVVLRGRDPLAVLGGDPGAPWSVDVDPESLL